MSATLNTYAHLSTWTGEPCDHRCHACTHARRAATKDRVIASLVRGIPSAQRPNGQGR